MGHLRFSILLAACLFLVAGCGPIASITLCNEAAHVSDLSSLQGTWAIDYGFGIHESITLVADGSFRQAYYDGEHLVDSVEAPTGSWVLESAVDNGARIRLSGARYYPRGIKWAIELQAYRHSVLYDPYTDQLVPVAGGLPLNVRIACRDETVLQHLWFSSDRGFPLLGADSEIYHRR